MSGLSVILLSWRDEDAALQQAQRVLQWTSLAPSVIWVRNESSHAPVSALPGLTLVDQDDNAGYAGGINAGLRHAVLDRSHVLLLNNDVEIEETRVIRLLERLVAEPEIGVIGPVLDENGTRSYGGRDPLRNASTRIHRASAEHLCDVAYVPGTVLLARADVFRQVDVLDEAFFFSGEIADWCRRARAVGWRCAVDPTVVARHAVSGNGKLRSTLYRYYTLRNRFLMARKQTTSMWPLWALYWTLLGLAMAAKAFPQDRRAARAVMWGLQDGWMGRFGNRNARFGN